MIVRISWNAELLFWVKLTFTYVDALSGTVSSLTHLDSHRLKGIFMVVLIVEFKLTTS